jgi:hypothetical protein
MIARPGQEQAANPSNPIYDGLIARGFSPAQAYALMGNMKQESEFSPGANNPKEGAYGLIQWRLERRADLENFAASQGRPANDLNTQLDFIKYEMTKGKEARNAAPFLAATDLSSANRALKGYIRYGDNTEGTRLANAQAYASGKVPLGDLKTGGTAGGAAGSAPPTDDWASLLGAESPPALADVFGGAVGESGPPNAFAGGAGVEDGIDNNLPQVDLAYAPASTPPEELGARYQQHKEARKLTPLGSLFTLKTIGQPPQKTAANAGYGRIG